MLIKKKFHKRLAARAADDTVAELTETTTCDELEAVAPAAPPDTHPAGQAGNGDQTAPDNDKPQSEIEEIVTDTQTLLPALDASECGAGEPISVGFSDGDSTRYPIHDIRDDSQVSPTADTDIDDGSESVTHFTKQPCPNLSPTTQTISDNKDVMNALKRLESMMSTMISGSHTSQHDHQPKESGVEKVIQEFPLLKRTLKI